MDDSSDASYRTQECESDDHDSNFDDILDSTLDDPTETENGDDVLASSVSNWMNVISSQKAFLLTGKQDPQSSVNEIIPIDVCLLFITDEIINEIVMETNRYTAQVLSSNWVLL